MSAGPADGLAISGFMISLFIIVGFDREILWNFSLMILFMN